MPGISLSREEVAAVIQQVRVEIKGTVYPTVVAQLAGAYWLVTVSVEAVMESAYVVENPETYLSQPDFERIGLLREVLP